jgi:hypothetical protein
VRTALAGDTRLRAEIEKIRRRKRRRSYRQKQRMLQDKREQSAKKAAAGVRGRGRRVSDGEGHESVLPSSRGHGIRLRPSGVRRLGQDAGILPLRTESNAQPNPTLTRVRAGQRQGR